MIKIKVHIHELKGKNKKISPAMDLCFILGDFDIVNFAKIAIPLGRGPGPAPPKILLTHFVSFKNLKLEITNFTAKKDLIESNKYSRFYVDLKILTWITIQIVM